MIESTVANLPELTAWKAETLRMTAILSPAAQLPNESLWEGLLGQPPENIISQPRTGIQQEEGPFEGGKLIVTVQPVRVDWILTVDNNRPTTISEFPSLGQFIDLLNPFVDLMTRWLEKSPPLQRLAFGANLLLPMAEEVARQQLFTYLHLNPQNFENSRDFAYQINRPRDSTSGISELKINRLSKWSAVTWKTIQVAPQMVINMPGEGNFACYLELDINTSPDYRGDFPKEKLLQIFKELVELGKEIAKEGDI